MLIYIMMLMRMDDSMAAGTMKPNPNLPSKP